MSSDRGGSSGAANGERPPFLKALLAYYLATPAFAVVDLLFHLPLRVALPGAGARAVYYAVVLGLGVVCARHPRAAPVVGIVESAANLTILMLAVLLPVWGAADAVLAGGEPAGPDLLLGRVANLALGGTVMVVSFHRAQAELLGSGR